MERCSQRVGGGAGKCCDSDSCDSDRCDSDSYDSDSHYSVFSDRDYSKLHSSDSASPDSDSPDSDGSESDSSESHSFNIDSCKCEGSHQKSAALIWVFSIRGEGLSRSKNFGAPHVCNCQC